MAVESVKQTCSGRYTVGRETFKCEREAGHGGVHIATIEYNGTLCDMGWKDSDHGAWRELADRTAPR